MATVSIANTTANISGKTVILAERDFTITGSWSFNRSPSAPFTVQAGSAVVTNLDADKLDGLHSTSLVLVDGSQSMGGALNLGATGQLVFPATQNPSAGVNTLDDYEEGTWVPVIGGSGGTSGQTYSSQVGQYVKVGQFVTATFFCVLTAKGTITGNVQIQGLPFTSQGSINPVGAVLWVALATTWVNVVSFVGAGVTFAELRGCTAAAATNSTNLATADIANTTQLYGTIVYRASA